VLLGELPRDSGRRQLGLRWRSTVEGEGRQRGGEEARGIAVQERRPRRVLGEEGMPVNGRAGSGWKKVS